MIKIQKSKPNRHKIYLLENCPSSINNREVLICNDYIINISIDFMTDTLISSKRFRTLNVIDDFNRVALAIEAALSIGLKANKHA